MTYSNGASAVVTANGRPFAAIDLWGPERLVPTGDLPHLGLAAIEAASMLEAQLVSLPRLDSNQ